MEGTTYGDVPLNAELKLEVGQPEQRGRHRRDPLREARSRPRPRRHVVAPSSYFMKSPPQQIHDDIAFNRVEAFIRGEDNETPVGTEAPAKRTYRKLATSKSAEGLRPRRRPRRSDRARAGARGAPPASRARTAHRLAKAAVVGYKAAERLLGILPRDRAVRRQPGHPGLVPAVAHEATLVEPELRARPRAAAGRPACAGWRSRRTRNTAATSSN